MITRGKIIFLSGMLILFSLIFNYSCTDEIEHGDPPKLPPSETFLMNFIEFPDSGDTLSSKLYSDSSGNIPSNDNWEYALTTLSEWNKIAEFPMAVSIAFYLEALKIDPVYIGNNSFGWSKNYLFLDEMYSARMVGNWVANLNFRLEIYIGKIGTNGFSRFKWLEGTILHDGTHGTWILYESPENPRRLLRIEWNNDLEKKTSDIKYTYLKQDPLPNGSSIQFKINNEFYHDASFTVNKPGKKVVIEWNRANNSGHISDPLKFKDFGAWHCWTDLLEDIDCE